ncbi:Lrp/AsnC family transcriptional regulator [Haloarchaeobius sp. DFWS5]|uniref:Lrp/AsnC family transcriptional regulator n=1 Tax=Haloarchaeobius sp. DFWS5 TaxID=3446114 RepID=UPI003EB9E730
MREPDDIDLHILRLLLEDASRTYSDIAELVDVSPPTVSDRIDRLRAEDVIRRFTIDYDSAKLADGVAVLVEVDFCPSVDDSVLGRLAAVPAVEHAFMTADSRAVLTANAPPDEVRKLLTSTVDMDVVERFDVRLLAGAEWQPHIAQSEEDLGPSVEKSITQ